jgi:Holliday junction DNA helicase RuvB
MPEPTPHSNSQPLPPTLNHVIGQRQVVERLKLALDAAFADSKPFCHTLLLGPPGLGKTTFAKIVSTELAAEFHEALGQTLTNQGTLNGFLLKPAQDKAVLFIDEIHGLSPICQTALYRAMEEGAIFLRNKDNDSTTKLQTVRFTLIGATTDPHLLLPPLRDRFKLLCQLQPYGAEELVAIMRQRARQIGWVVEDTCFAPIAQRSFGTPRLALRLLEAAHRTARAEGASTIDMHHLERTCALECLDDLGLGPDEQRYLAVLADSQGPVRLNVVASKLRLGAQTVSRVIEERLLYFDLIERAQQGRLLTVKGIEHFRRQRAVTQETTRA